jgi:prevent-host-death family protein
MTWRSALVPAQLRGSDAGESCYHGHEAMVTKRKKDPTFARETAIAHATESEGVARFSREVSAGEFKARCLALMDEVRDRGGEYVITKRGVPVAKLVPVRLTRRPLRGSMKGTVKVSGDIVSPLEEPWEALEGWSDEP